MKKNFPLYLGYLILQMSWGSSTALALSIWNSTTTGGDWNTAGNWSEGVPTSSLEAQVGWEDVVNTSQSITLSANGTARGLILINEATAGTQSISTGAFVLDLNDNNATTASILMAGNRGMTLSGRFNFTDAVAVSTSSTAPLTFDLSGANITGTGALIVNQGIVNLQGSSSVGNRSLVAGDSTGLANSAVLNLASASTSGGTTYTSALTVRSDGLLQYGIATQTTWGSDASAGNRLVMDGGGSLDFTGSGTLTLRNNGSSALINAASGSGTITISASGNGILMADLEATAGTASRTINVGSNNTLRISARLSDGDDNMSYTKNGAGTLELMADNSTTLDGTGNFTVNVGALLVSNSSGSGTGAKGVTLASGTQLGGTGTIGGASTITGSVRPGALNSIGTLVINNNVTWNGSVAGDAWVYQLGASNTSDRLQITGNFQKGTGSGWRFDLGGSTLMGDYTLVTWTGTTTFVAGDFTAVNLGADRSGIFTVNSNSLTLAVVPESSSAALLVFAGLIFCVGRALIQRSSKMSKNYLQ